MKAKINPIRIDRAEFERHVRRLFPGDTPEMIAELWSSFVNKPPFPDQIVADVENAKTPPGDSEWGEESL